MDKLAGRGDRRDEGESRSTTQSSYGSACTNGNIEERFLAALGMTVFVCWRVKSIYFFIGAQKKYLFIGA